MKLHRTLNPGFGPLLFVPFANVAAVLLIFFLLSGGFLLQPGVAVKVPDSPFLLAPQRDPRVASITGDPVPAIYFDNRRIDARELGVRLAAVEGNARTLIIKADRRAPVDLLVQVVNAAVSHGFSVVLATGQEP
ncbi:MAG: biopolymer transporter ExbD [Terrimicrobiaceae bacterium]|nr:biopolymer transporter ExbD [Terrimicrobiaceae bacterium]